jgi:hypothetical protein
MSESRDPRPHILTWREVLSHPSWNAESDAVVWIAPGLFDAAWRRGSQWMSPGGRTGAQGDRYRRIGEWIDAGNTIDMCVVWMNEDGVGFTNGRHRFAWLRDRGLRAMPMQIAPADADAFAKLFGTGLRISILPPRN